MTEICNLKNAAKIKWKELQSELKQLCEEMKEDNNLLGVSKEDEIEGQDIEVGDPKDNIIYSLDTSCASLSHYGTQISAVKCCLEPERLGSAAAAEATDVTSLKGSLEAAKKRLTKLSRQVEEMEDKVRQAKHQLDSEIS